MATMKALLFATAMVTSVDALAQGAAQAPPVDPYPGATMLPPGSIATIAQPPAINSRIGPGSTPRGVAFPAAGQLMQGTKYRATQSAAATTSPACSRGWVQVFALEPGQNVVPNNRDVWICRGDGALTYATVSTPDASAAQVPAPAPSPAPGRAPAGGSSADTNAPSTPVAIVVGVAGANSANLNWNPATDTGSSGLAGYRIERCTGQNCRDFREIATAARPPYADGGLTSGTTYSYRIRAFDNAGNRGEYTSVALVTMPPPAGALPDLAISELKAPGSGVAGTQINVSAVAVNKGATATGAYRLAFYFSNDQSATTFSGTYCEMAPLAPGASWPCSGTVAAPASLPAGTYWLVAFADDLGHVAEKDENNNTGAVRIVLSAAVTPQAGTVPSPPSSISTLPAPAGLAVAATGNGAIRMSWNIAGGNAQPAGYKIERCAGSRCANFSQVGTSTGNSHTDAGLSPGTSYSYRIRGFDNAGNSTNYSNVASAVTSPAAPGLFDRSNSQ